MHQRILAFALLGSLIVPAVVRAQADLRDNIVIVLDASGSMRTNMAGNRTRMEVAKEALLKVAGKFPKNTQVGLLVFSASNLKDDWVYPLGPLDSAKLEAAIKLPQPGSSTPLGAYMKKGTDALLKQREKQRGYGTYRLLVVTDGEATDAPVMHQYLPDILSRGIIVDAIGLDMKSDHALATKVHSYRRGNNPEELQKALSSVIGEIGPTKDAVAGAEAFEILSGIPDDVAKGMLMALTAPPGNHPIGEKPPAPPIDVESGGGPVGTMPVPLPTTGPSGETSIFGWFCLGFLLVVGAIAFGVIYLGVKILASPEKRTMYTSRLRRRRDY